MIKSKKQTLAAIAVAFISFSLMGKAEAAVVTHDYQLNGSYADSFGGPDINPNGGTLGATGYTFDRGQGLNLSNAINPTDYSIQMLFSINETNGYRKLIDFKNLTSDRGLYNLSQKLNFYPISTAAFNTINAGDPINLVVTRDSATNTFNGYINGSQQISFVDSSNDAIFNSPNNIAHFLRDDFATGGVESSSGFLDRVRIWDGSLTATEATAISRSAEPVPEPMTILGSALGLSFGGWMQKKYGKKRQVAVAKAD